jgi:hypothetical protein
LAYSQALGSIIDLALKALTNKDLYSGQAVELAVVFNVQMYGPQLLFVYKLGETLFLVVCASASEKGNARSTVSLLSWHFFS